MAESPRDWARLISEVDEVKTLLWSRGVREYVNADGILYKLEKITNECGRVNAVVDEIIAGLNFNEPDVVVVDEDEDSEVELVYQGNISDPIAAYPDPNQHQTKNSNRPRGVKRHVAKSVRLASSDKHKRSMSSTCENSLMGVMPPVNPKNPVVDPMDAISTINSTLPEKVSSHIKEQDQIKYLKDVFPKASLGYLEKIVENCRGNEIHLNEFVTDALENNWSMPQEENNHQLLNKLENLPSCSRSVSKPLLAESKFPATAQSTSAPLIILEADSTTPSIQTEGAGSGVAATNGSALTKEVVEIPGASRVVNELGEGTSSVQHGSAEDADSEERDDLEKSIIYSGQLEYLIGVLPDADPEFLEEKVSEFEGDANKLKAFVAAALECPGGQRVYRTRGESQKLQEHKAQVMKLTENFSVEDFLEVFPDPVAHFENPNRVPDLSVRDHSLAYLKARYKCLYVNTITQTYKKERFNLSLTVKELDKDKYPKRKTRRSLSDCKLPPNQCISFLQEVAYLENKTNIKQFIESKKLRRQEKFEEAKAKNELLTCNCCFDDELLSEDMSSCTEGHLFCIQCVKKGAEVIIGDGKSKFPCMHENCTAEFSLSTLQAILSPSIFGKLVMRLQAEEVNAAGIEGLETCPSCPYSTIPAPEDKVFKCLNPECMKETCRSCKEPSHIPLKCEEVEKNEEVKARTYIENKMTEALIRTCWKCNRQFIKESGCNKMQCTCGALMCYICRQPVKDYQHFNPNKGQPSQLCPLYSDDVELHIQPVKKEAEKAKEEMMRQNPKVILKHDPTLKLPERSARQAKHPQMNPFLIEHDDNPMDYLLMNMHEYFNGRIHGRVQQYRRDVMADPFHPGVNNYEEYGLLPEARHLIYDIPAGFNPQPYVEPMPRGHVPRDHHPPDLNVVRPYNPPNNVPQYQVMVNNPAANNFHVQLPARNQPAYHHVYPPPPQRLASRNNSKH